MAVARPELREEPENFLESMLAAQELDGTFTDDKIIGNTFTLLLAGEDTTAHTMAWTVWLLAARSDIQARWAQEAREVLGEDLFPVGYETIEPLRYGEAALRESMRLKPVAPIMGLEPLGEATICDTHIPAGTRLMLLSRLAGLGAGGFERANEFCPERWLDDAGDAAGTRDPRTFLHLCAGPRFCPGEPAVSGVQVRDGDDRPQLRVRSTHRHRRARWQRFAFTRIPTACVCARRARA